MPDGGNPFITISETNQPLCLAGVEYTVLLSVGREYRLTVFAHRVEDTDELSTFEETVLCSQVSLEPLRTTLLFINYTRHIGVSALLVVAICIWVTGMLTVAVQNESAETQRRNTMRNSSRNYQVSMMMVNGGNLWNLLISHPQRNCQNALCAEHKT